MLSAMALCHGTEVMALGASERILARSCLFILCVLRSPSRSLQAYTDLGFTRSGTAVACPPARSSRHPRVERREQMRRSDQLLVPRTRTCTRGVSSLGFIVLIVS